MKIPYQASLQSLALAAALLAVGCSNSTDTPSGPGSLVVSQILYHNPSDSLEWIEIRNDGTGPAILAGVNIDAVGYQFGASEPTLAPKARIILTNSQALFTAKYPGVVVHGVYTGRLSDEGEEVQLDGAEGKDFKFSYEPSEPWPVGARVGASLVYLGGDPASPSSWGASSFAGGKPGEDATVASDKGVWISEVRPADASGNGFVELASGASESVDVGGWIVASSLGAAKSDTIPSGTAISAHGRIVLRQTPASGELGWGRLLPSPNGGDLLLIGRANGSITGNVHSIAWKAIPDGMSVGRIGATGTESGIGLIASPTPGTGDAGRKTGLATITEVCYDPGTGGGEFVEIRNETDSVIHLGYPADSLRSWSLSGTGKTFVSTDTLPAKGFMLLFAKDEMTAAAFRTRWNIPDNVPVVGYSGKLSNSGETLELRHPLVPLAQNNGSLEWAAVVEDAANWLPDAPWPAAANGGGSCLQRQSSTIPGTSIEAWAAALPTPGK